MIEDGFIACLAFLGLFTVVTVLVLLVASDYGQSSRLVIRLKELPLLKRLFK